MRSPRRYPLRAASLLLCAAGVLAQEPESRSPIVPLDWLVISGVGVGSESLAPGDPVFARYLLDPESPPPEPGESVAGLDGEERRWTKHDGSGDEIHAPNGYAYTSVITEETGVWMARLSGARTLFVNGDGFTGDELRRGFQGVPVELRAGRNNVFVTGIRDSFRLTFTDSEHRLVIGTWDVNVPRITRDTEAWSGGWNLRSISPILFNASSARAEYHLRSGGPVPDHEDFEPVANAWVGGGSIAPLSLIRPAVRFSRLVDIPEDLLFRTALLPIEVFTNPEDVAHAVLRIDLLGPEDPAPRHGSHNPVRDAALVRNALDPDPAGPFARFFKRTCFLVHGTAGSDAEDEALLSRARYDLQRLWSRYSVVPPLVTDEELFRQNIPRRFNRRFSNVILYGNEDTNSALRSLVRDESPCRVRRGRARVNGELHEGEDLLCVFAFTSSVYGADARFEVGVLADTGPAGCRLGYAR